MVASLNMVLQQGDLLMLWTCSEAGLNYPLVTLFVVHDATLFHLRIAISIAYDNGRLSFCLNQNPSKKIALQCMKLK